MKKLFILIALLIIVANAINAQISDTMYIGSGWNLLSLPVKIGNTPISMAFPTAVSDAFLFENEYIHRDTIDNGLGFWLKFDSAETFILTGEAIYKDTVNVRGGWNMIGSPSLPILKSFVTTEPEGIIESDYFYFDAKSGYQAADTLKPGFGYWVKVNQGGSIILSSMDISCPGIPTVEYDGKTYTTVQVGLQCWLKQNLDVGTRINGSENQADNGTIEKYCYNDDTSNCSIYGGLYMWDEAMQYTTTPGTRGICPPGWHIPVQAEYQTLSTTVGGDGNALKAKGQGSGPGAGTNMSGFSGLLAGYRSPQGVFFALSMDLFIRSSTFDLMSSPNSMHLSYINSIVDLDAILDRISGLSIRCVKD